MQNEETHLKRAAIEARLILIIVVLIGITSRAVTAQKATSKSGSAGGPNPAGAKQSAAFEKLPKLWHSAGTNHDFRVEIKDDLFRADWVNIPLAAAKQGAYIHTECRRTGEKWVGTSHLKMLFAIPVAPAGKDTKLCPITVRFEVDSISPEKIVGHSEKLVDFDVNTCKVRQTSWGELVWTPKK